MEGEERERERAEKEKDRQVCVSYFSAVRRRAGKGRWKG